MARPTRRGRSGRRGAGKLKRLAGLASEGGIRQAISDLETLRSEAPVISVAAIHVLKNELDPVGEDTGSRRLLYERTFTLPDGATGWLPFAGWSSGAAERFRDECDRSFWEHMVPPVTEALGELAEPFLNTIAEVIINYAEYSFGPRAFFRRITAQVFLTDDRLAYGIVRPHGWPQRVFDPLTLTEKKAEALRDMKRGWGHTLLMRRALFLSFDQAPKRRGMMMVIGPED